MRQAGRRFCMCNSTKTVYWWDTPQKVIRFSTSGNIAGPSIHLPIKRNLRAIQGGVELHLCYCERIKRLIVVSFSKSSSTMQLFSIPTTPNEEILNHSNWGSK